MHPTSMNTMQDFIEEYGLHDAKVVDVGSLNLNGTYRGLFAEGVNYIGVDLIPGDNVDIIVDSPEWFAIKDVDVVICGQTIEHCEDIPKLMDSMFRVLKTGGLLCVIAPSGGPPHNPPWFGVFGIPRMTELVEGAGFEVIRCDINPEGEFHDCCCVAKKPLTLKVIKKVEDEQRETKD
jgi:SAM-dependent methyltransferase